VKDACVPFLRCCALFYHFLTGVPGPDVLMEVGGDSFENLCAYLGLPDSYHELVSSSVVFDLSVKWAKHEKVRITFCIADSEGKGNIIAVLTTPQSCIGEWMFSLTILNLGIRWR
jgi:hypothetical protein